jgi:hypothetical protein
VTVTVPAGVPDAGATGTTVKLTSTAWPTVEGDGESPVIVVVVLGRVTVSEATAVAGAWIPLPA